MSRLLLALSIAVVCTLFDSAGASVAACWNPNSRYTYYPSCGVPVARPDEEVVVVTTNNGSDFPRATNISVSHESGWPTIVLDLEVKQSEKPLYVVLSSLLPVLWRFEGATDRISRVIALGSTQAGADHVGVAGVSRDKVVFTQPGHDVHADVDGPYFTKNREPTMCDFIMKACNPNDYYFRFSADGSDNAAALKSRTAFHALVRTNYTEVLKGNVCEKKLGQPCATGDPDSPISNTTPSIGKSTSEIIIFRSEDIASPIPVTVDPKVR